MLRFLPFRPWSRPPSQPDAAAAERAILSPVGFMAERRVSFVLRSLAHVLFAIAFFWPALSQPMVVRLFAGYLFVDGILALAPGGFAWRSRRVWPLLAGGLIGVATASVIYGWPGLSFAGLVTAAALWAMAVGFAYGFAALTLREADRDYLLLLGSIFSLLFARALLSHMAGDLVVLSTWMGLYALTMGVVTLNLTVKQYRLSW